MQIPKGMILKLAIPLVKMYLFYCIWLYTYMCTINHPLHAMGSFLKDFDLDPKVSFCECISSTSEMAFPSVEREREIFADFLPMTVLPSSLTLLPAQANSLEQVRWGRPAQS